MTFDSTIAILGVVLIAIAFWLGRVSRQAREGDNRPPVPGAAKDDPLLALVELWRTSYMNFCQRSKLKYYWLTGTAFIATSLVTALGAIGGWISADNAKYFLAATTLLGFIATVATGFDKLFNDRKDYLRAARYSTLFDLEIFKYLYTKNPGGLPQSALVAAVSKLRNDELSDWMQDETSATLDIQAQASAGATNGVLRAQLVASEARAREQQSSAALFKAKQDASQADLAFKAASDSWNEAVKKNAEQDTVDDLKRKVDVTRDLLDQAQAGVEKAQTAEVAAAKAAEQAEADVERLRNLTMTPIRSETAPSGNGAPTAAKSSDSEEPLKTDTPL